MNKKIWVQFFVWVKLIANRWAWELVPSKLAQAKGTDLRRSLECKAVCDLPLRTPKGATPQLMCNMGETASSISLRLTLPKLQLSHINNIIVLLFRIFLVYVKSNVERTTRQSLPQTSCTLWDSILDSWGITTIDSQFASVMKRSFWHSDHELLSVFMYFQCHCIFFTGHIGSFWRLWWTSSLSLCMVSCLVFCILDHQSHCFFQKFVYWNLYDHEILSFL